MFNGNFAGAGHIVYDPTTYNASSGTRQPFPNNVIPASQINPVARNLLKYYGPGTSLASMPSNLYGNPRNTLRDDQGGLRLDAASGSRSQIFFQIFGQTTPSDKPGLCPLSGLFYQNGSQLAMVEHIWSVNPRAVNSLRIRFLRNIAIGGNEGQDSAAILHLLGISNTNDTHGVTAINLLGYSGFGRSNGEVGNRDNAWQFDDEIRYSRGEHSFAFGVGLPYRRGWHWSGNIFYGRRHSAGGSALAETCPEADVALGKWTITAITTFASGPPILLSGPNQTGSTLLNSLPNRVCDGRNSQLSGNIRKNGFLWFDTECFLVPAVGFFGDSGPTVLNGPGVNNWDMGAQKSFVVPRELVRLQLRREVFNTWNHTQFQPPIPNSGAGANFGRISASRPPRLIQLALKFAW